jgi:hypothetical protein
MKSLEARLTRRLCAGLFAAFALCATPGLARAGVFDVYAQAEGGGATGMGLAGVQMDNDFFQGAAGGLYGAKVGAEVLFTDVWVEHWQLTDFKGLTGTWTQFMIGADVDFPLGDTPQGQKPKTFAELGFAAGYGLGTGQQVQPPLDNAQVTDKGFIGQLSLGVDYRFSKVTSIGLAVPITYGYLFKNGEGAAANNSDNQYHQLAVAPMVYFRFSLGFGK